MGNHLPNKANFSTDQTEIIQKYIDGAKSIKINHSSGHKGYEKYSVVKEKWSRIKEDSAHRSDHRAPISSPAAKKQAAGKHR